MATGASADLPSNRLEVAIRYLKARIADLKSFPTKSVTSRFDPTVAALEAVIERNLVHLYGRGSSAFERLRSAAVLDTANDDDEYPEDIRVGVERGTARALELLRGELRMLQERFEIERRDGSRPAGLTRVFSGEMHVSADPSRRVHVSPDPVAIAVDDEETRKGLKKKSRKRRPPKGVDQRPAAYRFTSHGDKIDVLPEPPKPLDRQTAADTHQELLAKARDLLARLQGSNSAQRVCDSVRALADALDVRFEELRPGVLLSRVRSLDADRAAFDTEEARAELFPDAFARADDVVQSARDLLAIFPLVRQIEAERLALELDRRLDALPVIEQGAKQIEEAARQSGAVTESAVRALAQNDAAIRAARDPVLRNSLIADKLLVIGNFARAVAEKAWTEIGEIGADSWKEIKEKLPKGVGAAARAAPLMGLVTLTVWIAGPVIGVAAAVPAWKSLSGTFQKLADDSPRTDKKNTRTVRSSGAEGTRKQLKSEADLLRIAAREMRRRKITSTMVLGIDKTMLTDWYLTVNGQSTAGLKIFGGTIGEGGRMASMPPDLIKQIEELEKELRSKYILDEL
jgi:hypothetical protein